MSAPEWFTTDWKKAFFAAERRLSPKLEQLVRTDAALDALAVATGLTRFAARTVTAFGNVRRWSIRRGSRCGLSA